MLNNKLHSVCFECSVPCLVILFLPDMSFLSLLRFRRLLAWEKPMLSVSVRFVTSGNKNSSPSKGLSYPGKPKHSSSYQAIIIGGGDFWLSQVLS